MGTKLEILMKTFFTICPGCRALPACLITPIAGRLTAGPTIQKEVIQILDLLDYLCHEERTFHGLGNESSVLRNYPCKALKNSSYFHVI